MRFGTKAFKSMLLSTFFAGITMAAAGNTYAAGPFTCNVYAVGYRTDMNRLKISCTQGKTFWAYEASANASCSTKATYDAIKMFHSTATSSLLSGKAMTIYYVPQSGAQNACPSTDLVPTEIYLTN